MSQIIKGDDLMVFVGDKSIAWATSHTRSLSADVTETSTKDHGIYGGKEVNKITWEISSENLYSDSSYDELEAVMLSRQKVTLKWGKKNEDDPEKTVADGDYDNWTPLTPEKAETGDVLYRQGDAYITSLSVNAASGANATFSVTFSGTGAIKVIKKA